MTAAPLRPRPGPGPGRRRRAGADVDGGDSYAAAERGIRHGIGRRGGATGAGKDADRRSRVVAPAATTSKRPIVVDIADGHGDPASWCVRERLVTREDALARPVDDLNPGAARDGRRHDVRVIIPVEVADGDLHAASSPEIGLERGHEPALDAFEDIDSSGTAVRPDDEIGRAVAVDVADRHIQAPAVTARPGLELSQLGIRAGRARRPSPGPAFPVREPSRCRAPRRR